MRWLLALSIACAPAVPEGSDDLGTDDGWDQREPFACGEHTCAVDEYCYTFVGGVPDEDGNAIVERSCRPADCEGPPTCACLAGSEDCHTDCEDEADGVFCSLYAP